MIAVTFALPAESRKFLRSLSNKYRTDRSSILTFRGNLDNRTIEVLHTGVGETVCRQRMAVFLQDRQFDYLISAGFAGALNDKLCVGDLLLAKNLSTIELPGARSVISSLQIHVADLLTIPSMIDSPKERKRMAQNTGATAADMETEFIARACAERALPLLSLRVISDTPTEPFPAPAQVLFDIAKQRTDLAKLGAFFLTHPARIPHVIQFARRIAQAREALARAIVNVIRVVE